MHFKNRPSRSRGGFRRVNPYNGSFQRSRRNSYRRKAHSAFLTRLHICLRNLDILWPSLREAKPPVRFPVYAHLWEYRWVFPLRKRGPWPHQSLQIKNRLLKAVFFSPSIQLSPPSFISLGNVLQQPHPTTDYVGNSTPLRFPHQKNTRNILRRFGTYAAALPDYPSKNRRKRFP